MLSKLRLFLDWGHYIRGAVCVGAACAAGSEICGGAKS